MDSWELRERPWLSCEKPLVPIGPPSVCSMDLRVSDLRCPLTNQWELDKIREYLPQYESQILRIFTSSAPSSDHLAWLCDKSGRYNTRSGYSVGMMNAVNSPITQPLDWMKTVWNVKTAPKIKDFLWRLARKAIPVSENLATRGVASFPCKLVMGWRTISMSFYIVQWRYKCGNSYLWRAEYSLLPPPFTSSCPPCLQSKTFLLMV